MLASTPLAEPMRYTPNVSTVSSIFAVLQLFVAPLAVMFGVVNYFKTKIWAKIALMIVGAFVIDVLFVLVIRSIFVVY